MGSLTCININRSPSVCSQPLVVHPLLSSDKDAGETEAKCCPCSTPNSPTAPTLVGKKTKKSSQLPTRPCMVWPLLPLWPQLLFAPSSPAALASVLFLEHRRRDPARGSLHLSPLEGFSSACPCGSSFTPFKCLLKCLLREACPALSI